MSKLDDFAIKVDRSYDEVHRRILDDCEEPANILVAFGQQFSRYTNGQALKRFTCRQTGDNLTVDKPILYRNSFALQMNLEFAQRENATRVICRFRVHVIVKIFLLVFIARFLFGAVVVVGSLIASLFNGTKTVSDSMVLGVFPLFGGFIAGIYFLGRKISELNAIEMRDWLLGLFPYRSVNLEK